MRFGDQSKRANRVRKKTQQQLFFLCLSFVVILAATRVVSKPGFWNWMFPETASAQTEHPPTGDTDSSPSVQGPDSNTPEPESNRETDSDSKPVAKQNSQQPQASDDQPIDRSIVDGKLLLKTIKDDSLGVRASEADAFYAFLAYARQQAPATSDSVAPFPEGKPVPRILLLAEPDRYRGKWVTVEGSVQRLLQLPNPDPRRSFDQLYEIWLATPDASGELTRIVCSEIPDGMPRGELTGQQDVWIRLNGLFFKREAYEARDGLQVAPLILAHQPVWVNRQQVQNRSVNTRSAWLGWLGLAAIIALYFVIRGRQLMAWAASNHNGSDSDNDDFDSDDTVPSFDWLNESADDAQPFVPVENSLNSTDFNQKTD